MTGVQTCALPIYPVIVRRSRIDLQEINEYAEDLKMQNIQFPEVVGPELVEYDLGNIRQLYISTLEKLSNQFICARYNPSEYLINPQEFNKKYGELFGEMNIQLFQGNLAKFIKRLLVMRFESSKAAFKSTLTSLFSSYENIKKWWAKGYVPIKKQGRLPDPNDEEILETLSALDDKEEQTLDVEKIKKKAIPIPKELFKEEFIQAVESDINLLKGIYKEWFADEDVGEDPKYNETCNKIRSLLYEDKNRKIVVFSTFADKIGRAHV